jgi:hypothetical protein
MESISSFRIPRFGKDIYTISISPHSDGPHILERLGSDGPVNPKRIDILKDDEFVLFDNANDWGT